jgi:DNA-binding PadR family transcriptional regulator
VSDEGRRAKFYRLTGAGRKQLVTETRRWRTFATAMDLVLEGA